MVKLVKDEGTTAAFLALLREFVRVQVESEKGGLDTLSARERTKLRRLSKKGKALLKRAERR